MSNGSGSFRSLRGFRLHVAGAAELVWLVRFFWRLQFHNESTDSLNLVQVSNEFVSGNESQQRLLEFI